MMTFMRFLVLSALLAASAPALAKGIFQAEGTISEVFRFDGGITFRFKGTISSGYATAPESHAKRRWIDLAWDAVDIPVRVGWRTDELHAALTEVAHARRRIRFSLDNPTFTFSNRGYLARVSGTRIHVAPTE